MCPVAVGAVSSRGQSSAGFQVGALIDAVNNWDQRAQLICLQEQLLLIVLVLTLDVEAKEVSFCRRGPRARPRPARSHPAEAAKAAAKAAATIAVHTNESTFSKDLSPFGTVTQKESGKVWDES